MPEETILRRGAFRLAADCPSRQQAACAAGIIVTLMAVGSVGSAVAGSSPQNGGSGGERLSALRHGVVGKIRPQAHADGDIPHALIGFGPTGTLLSRVSASLEGSGPHGSVQLSSELLAGEDHLGETTAALAQVLGSQYLLDGPDGPLPVGDLIENEKGSQRLQDALAYLKEQLQSDVTQLIEFSAQFVTDPSEMTAEDFRFIRTLQHEINSAELSWLIEAISYQLAESGQDFDTTWQIEDAELSLDGLLALNIRLFHEDRRASAIPLLTESGIHFLFSLAVVYRLFEGDPALESRKAALDPIMDELVDELIRPPRQEFRPRPSDFVVAAHVLEFLHDDAYYKPDRVLAADTLSTVVESNLALLEMRVRSREVLGFAFGMHALNAIDHMLHEHGAESDHGGFP